VIDCASHSLLLRRSRIFGAVNPLPNIDPSWNLAPARPALVVQRHPDRGERRLDMLQRGLLPYFTVDPRQLASPQVMEIRPGPPV
jgi:hypothetical protein